jgi:ribosome-binding factor A
MTRRSERVGELIKAEVSALIQHDLRDPRLGLVSITRVEASPDMRTAKIFFSVLGDEEKKKDTIKVLRGAAGYLRREIAPRLQLRHVPQLFFQFDEAMEHGDKIQRMLLQLEQEEKARAATNPPDQNITN